MSGAPRIGAGQRVALSPGRTRGGAWPAIRAERVALLTVPGGRLTASDAQASVLAAGAVLARAGNFFRAEAQIQSGLLRHTVICATEAVWPVVCVTVFLQPATWSAEQVRAFLVVAVDDRLHAARRLTL
jgi:hypothetical protein